MTILLTPSLDISTRTWAEDPVTHSHSGFSWGTFKNHHLELSPQNISGLLPNHLISSRSLLPCSLPSAHLWPGTEDSSFPHLLHTSPFLESVGNKSRNSIALVWVCWSTVLIRMTLEFSPPQSRGTDAERTTCQPCGGGGGEVVPPHSAGLNLHILNLKHQPATGLPTHLI